MVSRTLIVNPIEQRAPQHYVDPVIDPVLVYGIGPGQTEESGTKRRTYSVHRSSKAGRILALPPSACSPLPEFVRLLYTHPTGFLERLTNYEVDDFVAPQSSRPKLFLRKPNGLGNVQTMEVDHLVPTILGQREVENNL